MTLAAVPSSVVALFVAAGLAVLVGLVALLAMAVKRARRRHRLRCEALARELGLDYSPNDPFDLARLPFAAMQAGVRRYVTDVMWGEGAGAPVKLFTLTIESDSRTNDSAGFSSTDTRRTLYSCALLDIPATCPHIIIRPEGWLHFKRGGDLQFESEDFNRAFIVTSDEAKSGYTVIDNRMMEWLLEARAKSKRSAVEIVGSGVLWVAPTGRHLDDDMRQVLELALAFRAHLPHAVFKVYPLKSA